MIIIGKIYSEKILNKVVVKDMIRKSWQLKSNSIIKEEGPNIFIIHLASIESAMDILNNTYGVSWVAYSISQYGTILRASII